MQAKKQTDKLMSASFVAINNLNLDKCTSMKDSSCMAALYCGASSMCNSVKQIFMACDIAMSP